MKRLLLLGCVLTTLQCSLYAQRDPGSEILVYFVDGVKREKQSAKSAVAYKQQLRSTALKSKLAEMEITEDMLETAMPNFNEADTLKTTPSGEKISILNMSKLCRIKVKPGQSREQLIKKLRDLPEVLYAEPNGLVIPLATPSDGNYGSQWGLKNLSVPGEDIHAEAAWDIYTGNPNNIIGIIDGGVQSTHADLDAKIAGGDSGFGWSGHGIHVAGIAAAETNNGTEGIAGVDWNAKIHAQRVDTTDDAGTLQAILDAVNYSPNLLVLNHSWGMGYADRTVGRNSLTVRQGFAYAYKNNRTSVVAMGNHQFTQPNVVSYPAGFENVIAVGATSSSGAIAGFSAQGPHIDVSAPGVNILSSVSGGYAYMSGTSMAAPHVSGIASLLKGYKPNLSNDDIENIIRLSADDKGATGLDNVYGQGRVNAEKALNYLRTPYTLQQLTASGGTVYSTSNTYSQLLISAHPSLPSGNYLVKRKEVRRAVTFPPMCQIVGVWGVGVGSTGWRMLNPNFGEGFVEVVPGTLTSTGATLRTYVYEVTGQTGQILGHFPAVPVAVNFKYSILGVPVPTPSISGPAILCNSQTYEIAGLPAGATVTWSSTWNSAPYPTLVHNSPAPNKLTINNTYMYPSTTTLTATITGTCAGTIVLTKNIASDYVSQVQHGTYTQEACWFYNTYNPASSGNLPTTANTPLYLRQGCMAVITLNNMLGKTVTFTGGTPVMYWAYEPVSSKLYVQLPYMSGGIPFTFKISGAGACQDKSILFFAYSQPYYPTYTFAATPNPATTNTLTLSATPNSERIEAAGKNATSTELSYSVRIVDLLTGQVVVDNLKFTGRLKEQIDISKLGKGLYNLQVISEGQLQNIRFAKE